MNKVDTVIKNGKLVTPSDIFGAGIAIDDGKIVQISKETLLPPAEESIDASGKLVFPGMIDPHVHFLWPNISKDRIDRPWYPRFHNFETGTESAAFGGVTTIIDFVYQYENEENMKEAINNRLEETRKSNIDYAFHTTLTGVSTPTYEELRNSIDAGLKAGMPSIKLFMSYIYKNFFSPNDKIYDAMVYMKQKDGLITLHAEDGHLWQYFYEKFEKEGPIRGNDWCIKNWSKAIPNFTVKVAVDSAITMAKHANVPLCIVHINTKEEVQAIANAKRAGQKVYAEAVLHYCLISDEDNERLGPLSKGNPPIRSKEDVEAIWRGIANGTVDTFGTDHTSTTKEAKDPGWTDWFKARGGIPEIEEALPLFYTEAVVKRGFSPTLLTRMMCRNPAKLFGLYPKKGTFMPGADADVVILDAKKEYTIKGEELRSGIGYSAYDGWKVTGIPTLVMLRGRTIVKDGEFYGAPGYGSYLPREPKEPPFPLD